MVLAVARRGAGAVGRIATRYSFNPAIGTRLAVRLGEKKHKPGPYYLILLVDDEPRACPVFHNAAKVARVAPGKGYLFVDDVQTAKQHRREVDAAAEKPPTDRMA